MKMQVLVRLGSVANEVMIGFIVCRQFRDTRHALMSKGMRYSIRPICGVLPS